MGYKNKDEQRAYQAAWLRKRRQNWLDKNGPCRCGSVVKLEVHHVDRDEKVDHRVWSWSLARQLIELEKCIVLCEKCHAEESRLQKSKPITHGTNSGYTSKNYRCRCPLCREAHRIKNAEYRGTLAQT